MTHSFDHRERGTAESAWAASRLATVPEISLPSADADVLILAAHPDDETLGAGGLIAELAAAGTRVHVVIATDGEASHPRSPTHSRPDLAGRRRREVVAGLKLLAPDAEVRFLGLPDGELEAHRGALVAELAPRVARATHIVSTWVGDRHPDHTTCASVADELARPLPSLTHWQYPVWAWHWADPATPDLPWPALRRLPLSARSRTAKRQAVAGHRSQHAPLSSAEGDEAILSPAMLSHFERAFETFVVSSGPAGRSGYFDDLYATSADPWGLATRFYEIRKRELLLAALPRPRFRRAFEPGCATGLLTDRLAERCEEIVAWDGAAVAVRRTRARGLNPGLTVEQRRIPDDWPSGYFDLIVLSEVGYYCSDLDALADHVQRSLTANGIVVACHWRHRADDHPHDAASVHWAVGRNLVSVACHREDDFVLDVWSRSGESVAEAEGIVTERDRP